MRAEYGSTSAFTLVRYNPDGTLDTSFNGAGKVITPIGNSGSGARDLAIQTDGKIVAAGYSLAAPNDLRTSTSLSFATTQTARSILHSAERVKSLFRMVI